MPNCPICLFPGEVTPTSVPDVRRWQCIRCGAFEITDSAAASHRTAGWTPRQTANACGWIRENQGPHIHSNDLQRLGELRTPSVAERADKLLLAMDRISKDIGHAHAFVFVDPLAYAGWLGEAWIQDGRELHYLVIEYLVARRLVGCRDRDGDRVATAFIAPDGYARIEALRGGNIQSAVGFCAMWFDQALLPVWADAMKPAIEGAGYRAVRMDSEEHNNRIDDENIARIRGSRFVVADFTGNRGGVYFEAGFAMGLALPVIWTVSKAELGNVHFDNRQYNFIDWVPGNLGELKARLQNRIEATLGRGPLAVATS